MSGWMMFFCRECNEYKECNYNDKTQWYVCAMCWDGYIKRSQEESETAEEMYGLGLWWN